MSGKAIANENWGLRIIPMSGSVPGGQQSITWILMKDPIGKVAGGAILVQQISWVVNPNICSFPGFPMHSGSLGVVPILSTTNKTKCGKKPVLRTGDKGSCTCIFTNPSSGATKNATCIFEIVFAGQAIMTGP